MSMTAFLGWFDRHYRRIIYILVVLCVLVPAFLTVRLRIQTTAATQGVFDAVEGIPAARRAAIANVETQLAAAGAPSRAQTADTTNDLDKLAAQLERLRLHTNGVMLISLDFDPSSAPELSPQAEIIIRHAFMRGIGVVAVNVASAIGTQLAQSIVDRAARETEGKYEIKLPGRDYVFLGFRPGFFNLILQMGEDINRAFATDYAGTRLDDMPFMQGIKNYNDIELVTVITGFVGVPETWIQVVKTKYNRVLGMGMTAVSVADYTPYLQSKQLVGLLPGMRGAAEYELALDAPAAGTRGMLAQLASHVLIIVLIGAGNVLFFLQRRR